MYKATDKISELISREEEAIQIISRFGLGIGVREQTIEQACVAHGVHTPTFLSVVNYKIYRQPAVLTEIDVPTLQLYLSHAHAYFLKFRLPRLRRALIEALIPADTSSQIPMLILRCYDEFVDEIRTHIEHEDQGLLEEHASDDHRITDKLSEIKNLIIKYFPLLPNAEEGNVTYTLISVMSDLWHTEHDFTDHCVIEDEILRPAMQLNHLHLLSKNKEMCDSEELSDRERDVLVQIVHGLSNKEIADVLCISTHTVISHRKNITRKLNIHSTAGLTVYAIVNKLVDINSLDSLDTI